MVTSRQGAPMEPKPLRSKLAVILLYAEVADYRRLTGGMRRRRTAVSIDRHSDKITCPLKKNV